jgi:hypothetical protein
MADTAALPAAPGAVRRWAGAAAVAAVLRGGQVAKKARAWRVHAAVPGLAGAGLVSAGFGLRLGLWAGLIAAGVFLLRIDSRL